MSGWEPGADPFPQEKIDKITGISYVGEMRFVRHAKAHLDTPKSLWQLTGDFGASMTVHPKNGTPYSLMITARPARARIGNLPASYFSPVSRCQASTGSIAA